MPSAIPSELQHALQAEAETIKRFVDLLKTEQEILGRVDIDALSHLVEEKSIIAAELSDLAAQRNATLSRLGVEADNVGIRMLLERHPAESQARDSWSEILLLAAEARELSRVNGQLIQIRMQHNRQALEALLGASRPLNLYGPDGQTTAMSSRRINDAA